MKTETPWQPIRTAPLDGSLVDIYTKSFGRVPNARWLRGCWRELSYGELGRDSWNELVTVVTHWMMIPERPDDD